MNEALRLHQRLRGKISLRSKIDVADMKTLSLVYTPYVADVSRAIYNKRDLVYTLTSKWNNIAIISDGSRILGLGDLGAEAALPVMEGKSLLYKQFGDIDAYPLCLSTKDKDEIITIIKGITGSFAAINIEDIESPKCLEIVDALNLPIPVFHDDQHGTAAVVLAALINALDIVKKDIRDALIVIAGAGAAGYGIVNLLYYAGARNMIVIDSKGIITRHNREEKHKKRIGELTNLSSIEGSLIDAIDGADVFIGVSGKANLIDRSILKKMNEPIIFALSNPDPEIMPEDAKEARIVATGRSDYPNQINNLLVFPFLMRLVLDYRLRIDSELLLRYAHALADIKVEGSILPSIRDIDLNRIKDVLVG